MIEEGDISVLTPNQIKNVMFTKSAVGGYKMNEVDEFILVVCNDYSRLYKENSELLLNTEALNERVKEYSENEDNIKTTLVTAQKMADKIVGEAKLERDRIKESTSRDFGHIIEDAKRQAREIVENATNRAKDILDEAQVLSDTLLEDTNTQVAHQQTVLNVLKEEIASFRERILGLYDEQVAKIQDLPAMEEDVRQQLALFRSVNSSPRPSTPSGKDEAKETAQEMPFPAGEEKITTPILSNITEFLNTNFVEDQEQLETPVPESIREEVEKQAKEKGTDSPVRKKKADSKAPADGKPDASVTQKGKMGVLKFGGKGGDDYDIFSGDDE